MKKILFAACGAALLFSCSKKENIETTPTGTQSLAMSVSASRPTSRSIDGAQVASNPAIQSLVVKVYNISGTQLGSDIAISGAQLTDLMNGGLGIQDGRKLILEQVDQAATYVEVRGYNNATAPAWVATADLDAKSANDLQPYSTQFTDIPFVSTAANAKDNITKTNDLGSGAHDEHKIWEVAATIKPYFARFEVSGTPTVGSGATLTIDGIYLNNIAQTKGATPTKFNGNGGNWVHNPTTGVITGTSGDFDPAYKTTFTAMYNETLTNYTNANQVDAYTLWAQNAMVDVVLKVTVSLASGDSHPGYVTIKSITGGTGAIEAGNIYKLPLGGLALTLDQITPQPYDAGADIYMTVTVEPWSSVTLTPGV